jgi:cellulose 1,4-beta-cellobiosidase
MFPRAALVATCFAAVVLGQLAGSLTPEVHPSLPTMKCTKSGGCVTVNTKITLDANWRWLHNAASGAYNNCYDGNKWDATLCPDPTTCMKNCALEGVDYASTYGISVSGNALNLKFVTNKNVGSRVYLMADDTSYQMFNLVGQEVS